MNWEAMTLNDVQPYSCCRTPQFLTFLSYPQNIQRTSFARGIGTQPRPLAVNEPLLNVDKDQTACKPGSVPPASQRTRRPFLWTAHRWTVLATYPDGSGRRGPVPDCSGTRRPYSVLLQAGLAMPPPLLETRCALTAPFHPYPAPRGWAVYFLWRYPWGRPRRELPAAYSPWSPDFPPPSLRKRATARPSGPSSGWA